MPKVFVINDMNHDFTKASKYGDLVTVTSGRVPVFKTDAVMNELKAALAEFSNDDYLLVSGPAIVCMMCMMVIDGFWKHRYSIDMPLKTLVFDAKNQEYVVRHLSL